MVKILFLILCTLVIFFNTPVQALTRPPSDHCFFTGTILSTSDKTSKISNIEQIEIEIELIEISTHGECKKFIKEPIIIGSWYPPDAKLPSGKLYRPSQPLIDKEKVKQGSRVTGMIDSYDHIVSDLTVQNSSINNADQSLFYKIWQRTIIFIRKILGIVILR